MSKTDKTVNNQCRYMQGLDTLVRPGVHSHTMDILLGILFILWWLALALWFLLVPIGLILGVVQAISGTKVVQIQQPLMSPYARSWGDPPYPGSNQQQYYGYRPPFNLNTQNCPYPRTF